MKRTPHNKTTPKAKNILGTIHSDIIGLINESFTGKRYILTIIDEFSRKSWLFLLEKKYDATDLPGFDSNNLIFLERMILLLVILRIL